MKQSTESQEMPLGEENKLLISVDPLKVVLDRDARSSASADPPGSDNNDKS